MNESNFPYSFIYVSGLESRIEELEKELELLRKEKGVEIQYISEGCTKCGFTGEEYINNWTGKPCPHCRVKVGIKLLTETEKEDLDWEIDTFPPSIDDYNYTLDDYNFDRMNGR